MSLIKLFTNLSLTKQLLTSPSVLAATQVRSFKFVVKPVPGKGKTQYRRVVHFPENGKYTVKPLGTTHLAGRDPVSGRKVAQGIGGGVKHKYHWVKSDRDGPSGEGEVQVEKVLEIIKCGCRTADIALVGVGDELKYILASENMKPGDLIKTSRFIPRIPVRAKEGDAYPLGALPVGTIVHNVEAYPGQGFHYVRAAGTFATILRKFEDKDGPRVVVQLPTKREFAFMHTCMATVGRLSNVEHGKTHIGSPQKLRELGYRPRSGLWHRKTGKHGRKIRKLPPMRVINAPPPTPVEFTRLTLNGVKPA